MSNYRYPLFHSADFDNNPIIQDRIDSGLPFRFTGQSGFSFSVRRQRYYRQGRYENHWAWVAHGTIYGHLKKFYLGVTLSLGKLEITGWKYEQLQSNNYPTERKFSTEELTGNYLTPESEEMMLSMSGNYLTKPSDLTGDGSTQSTVVESTGNYLTGEAAAPMVYLPDLLQNFESRMKVYYQRCRREYEGVQAYLRYLDSLVVSFMELVN